MTKSEKFKTHISGVFTRASSQYSQIGPNFFTYSGKKLVEFANVKEGAKVLDVACGRGAVLFPLSKAASAAGEVIGIDLADGMVERTRSALLHQGITNSKVVKMDAENLEFPDSSFDYVLCGLSLFFFPNLERALSEILRVLEPGGLFVSSTFQKKEQDENDETTKRWKELFKSFEDSLKPIPCVETKSLDNEDEIMLFLSKAGFVKIEVASDKKTFYFSSEDEWWETAWSHGARNFLERLDDEALVKYKEQAQNLIRLEKTEQGIPDTWHLLYSKAKKPQL